MFVFFVGFPFKRRIVHGHYRLIAVFEVGFVLQLQPLTFVRSRCYSATVTKPTKDVVFSVLERVDIKKSGVICFRLRGFAEKELAQCTKVIIF